MIWLWILFLSFDIKINCNVIETPQIRSVVEKTPETLSLPRNSKYRNFYENEERLNDRNVQPLKSYVIYDQYPYRIFKEWKGNEEPIDILPNVRPNFQYETKRQDLQFPPHQQNDQPIFHLEKPTLAYQSVYSNVIRVFDNSPGSEDQQIYFHGGGIPNPDVGPLITRSPFAYDFYPPHVNPKTSNRDHRFPENFPKIFSPNDKFYFSDSPSEISKPPLFVPKREMFYNGFVVGYKPESNENGEDAEAISEFDFKEKPRKRVVLCSFIKLNNKEFPNSGGACGRSEEAVQLSLPEYPNNSNLRDEELPVEHRHQNSPIKQGKTRGVKNSQERLHKRAATGFGYGYDSWGSPFGYNRDFNNYFNDYYPSQSSRDVYGSKNYRNYGAGNRNQGNRNRNSNGSTSNYNNYYGGYSNDGSNSRGLTSYLTYGGRRYQNNHNDNDNDYDNDDDNNDDYRNNNDDYSNEKNNDNSNNNNNNNNDNNSSNNNKNNNNDNDYDSDEDNDQQNERSRGSNDRKNNNRNSKNTKNNRNNYGNNNNNNNNNDNDNDYDDNSYRDNRRNRNNSSNKNNKQNNDSRRNNNRRKNNNNMSNNNNGSNFRSKNRHRNNNGNNYENSYENSNGYSNFNGYNNGYGSYNGFGNTNNNNGYGGYGGGYSSYGNNKRYGNDIYGGFGGSRGYISTSYGGGENYGSNNGYGSNGRYGNNGGYGSNYGGNGGYGYSNGYGGSGGSYGYFGQGGQKLSILCDVQETSIGVTNNKNIKCQVKKLPNRTSYL